jgi:hypothetical protein
MMRIGVVIHGPAVIDSGKARSVLEIISGMGVVQAILGGTMGRSAVIDAGMEGQIDISRNLKPSESIMELSTKCDIILLVNEGKSCETGLTFGSMVFGKLDPIKIPLYQIEFGSECILVPWTGESNPILSEFLDLLKARIIQPPPESNGIKIEGNTITREVSGARPGEYVTINGIVVGKALSDEVHIISESGEITGLEGGRLKQHGIEKLKKIDIQTAIVRSGTLRTANITPRVLAHSGSNYAVLIDHSAEDTFELAKDAALAVVVGDDTTAIAGDLLTRLGIPMIGITDGDKDGITHHTHVPPGSVIIRVKHGNDDVVGRRVCDKIFCGNGRIETNDSGFEEIFASVIQQAGSLVQEIVRY